MIVTYKNEHGTIRINGGGNERAWRMTEITGIGFPQKSFTYNTYAGVYGRELNAVTIPSRTVTVSGDISRQAQKNLSMSQAMRILNADGDLAVQTRGKIRRAKVRTLSFEASECKAEFKTFVLQMESDQPYFWGAAPLSYSIFSRQNRLSSPFTLPCVCSERHMSKAVVNGGDAETEPTLTITKPSGTDVVLSDAVVVQNEANGAALTLNHAMQPGETVTVNIPKRTIVSSISGNIISAISDDTVLSSFVLLPGRNQLSCTSGDTSLSVSCEFEELYLEASHDE